MSLYVQYGCGLSAPTSWTNFDASPTLRVQKIPVIGNALAKKVQGFTFPDNVRFGNIVTGLPLADNSADAVYCSHVLEHLTIQEFRKALVQSHRILKPKGIFRLVMPNLERLVHQYLENQKLIPAEASIKFMENTGTVPVEVRNRSFLASLKRQYANSLHLSLWDAASTRNELLRAGFSEIREAQFNDSELECFKAVEDESRFQHALAFQCSKS